MPACLEVCPTGSRKFGNVLDPESEVAYILRNKRVFVLKEEVGTLPRFFYYFDERGSRYRDPAGEHAPDGHACASSCEGHACATPEDDRTDAAGNGGAA